MEDLRPYNGADEEVEWNLADCRFPFLRGEVGELKAEGYLGVRVVGIEFEGYEGVFPECRCGGGADIGENEGVFLYFNFIGVDVLKGTKEYIGYILP